MWRWGCASRDTPGVSPALPVPGGKAEQGLVLSTQTPLPVLSPALLTAGQQVSVISHPVLQMWKPRYKEVKGHTSLDKAQPTPAHAAEPSSRTDAPRRLSRLPSTAGVPGDRLVHVPGPSPPSTLASQVPLTQPQPRSGQALWLLVLSPPLGSILSYSTRSPWQLRTLGKTQEGCQPPHL